MEEIKCTCGKKFFSEIDDIQCPQCGKTYVFEDLKPVTESNLSMSVGNRAYTHNKYNGNFRKLYKAVN